MVSGIFPDLPQTCHCVLSRPPTLAVTASPPKNREGLTWEEWSNAARLTTEEGKRAWSRGEDPTEYRTT
jgi:hypothetical protein